jgi:hypothetical protein
VDRIAKEPTVTNDPHQPDSNRSTPQYRVWGQDTDGDYDVLEERHTCPAPKEIRSYLADYTKVIVIAREAFPVYELSRDPSPQDHASPPHS